MKIFLSYASEDKAVAEPIAFSLRGRGHEVFFDRDNLPPGKSYDERIESAVNDSETFVFLISPDSIAHGRYSLTELTFARRKWPDPNGRMLPVMVRKTPLEGLPPYLRAVSFLEPVGNIAAETSSAVHNMRPLKERSEEFFVQYRDILGFGSVLGITAVLLGLGVPFCLAAATYAVFSWLDSNASDEAAKVISSWLDGRSQNKPDLGNLIIYAFDRLYTSPLLTLRAFRRSLAISSTVWVLVFLVPWMAHLSSYSPSTLMLAGKLWAERWVVLRDILLNVAILVMADYASLFFVRRFLNSARQHPIGVSLVSSLSGLIVVAIGYFVFTIISTAYMMSDIGVQLSWNLPTLFDLIRFALFQPFVLEVTGNTAGMVPAFIIHLWLPLFALSSLVARLVFWIFRAVEWAQWFLKQGDAHPFKAVGVVATIIVFGSAMAVNEVWTVL